MGGFVARAALVHPGLRKSAVETILTLSSPHQYYLSLCLSLLSVCVCVYTRACVVCVCACRACTGGCMCGWVGARAHVLGTWVAASRFLQLIRCFACCSPCRMIACPGTLPLLCSHLWVSFFCVSMKNGEMDTRQGYHAPAVQNSQMLLLSL